MSQTFSLKQLSNLTEDEIILKLNKNIQHKVFHDEQHRAYQYNPETCLYERIQCIEKVYRNEIRTQIITSLKDEVKKLKADDFDDDQDYFKEKAKYTATIKKYGSLKKMTEIIKGITKMEDKEYMSFDKLQKPYLLPLTNNKNIDLRTGELVKRTKEDFFTFCIDADYSTDINTTKAERFFNSLMSYDDSKIDALQQTLGAVITGELIKYIFIFFGPNGDNGKTELCNNILKGVLGGYHRTINEDIILSRKFKTATGPQPHMFSLKGGRCGIMSEINENERIDEKMFKSLSGGDTIETRNHHDRETTTFVNTTKPIFLLNKPFLLDTRDKATLARMVNIEFSASFKKDPKEGEFKQDPELIDYLKTPKGKGELLNWIVKGSIKFYDNGKAIKNDYITNATNSFVSLVDPVSGFMKRVRFNEDFKKFYSRSDIVKQFKVYLTTTPHSFHNKLKDAVYQAIEKKVKKVKRSVFGYRGLDIQEDYELDCYDENDITHKQDNNDYDDNDAQNESLKLHVKEVNHINEQYKMTIDKLLKEKEIMEQKIKDMEDKLHTITITKEPIENSDSLKEVFEEEEKITTKKKDKKKKVKEEDINYSKMKVKELRAYCKKLNLKTNVDKMKKKDIIKLLDSDEVVSEADDFDSDTEDCDYETEEKVISKSKMNMERELSEDELFDNIEL